MDTIEGRYGKQIELKVDEQPLDWTTLDKTAATNVLEYVRWMAEIDPDFKLSVGQLWYFYQQSRDDGIYPTEIIWDLGLEDYPDW